MLDEYDSFAPIFTIGVSVFGVIANSLLLYAISTRSSNSLRTYSTILLNTADVDLIASIAAVTRLVSSSSKATTFFIFTGPCLYAGKIPCWISHDTSMENQMWTSSNYLLCFAFAYRLRAVQQRTMTRKQVIAITLVIHLVNSAIACALFYLFLDNECTVEDIMAARPAYQSIDYEIAAIQFNNVWSIIDASFILSSSPIVFAATFVLRHLTMRTLEGSQRIMSSTTLDLHRMLVRTLNFQLALTGVMGIGCVVYLVHLLGMTNHPLAEILPCAIINLLPALAPVLNLICIRPYRMFLLRITKIVCTTTRHGSATVHRGSMK